MIDWQRVGELRDDFGAEDFGDILNLFLTEVQSAIDRYNGSDTHPSAVEEQMHFLKGAALNLGFATLAELCRKGEKAAATGDIIAVAPEDLRRCFADSKAHFATEYDQRFAA